LGLLASSAFGQARSWMVQAGSDPSAAPGVGPTSIVLSPGGGTVTIEVWIEDPAGMVGMPLNGNQIIMPWSASGGASGSVTYVDNNPGMGGGNSVLINTNNPDWLFQNEIVTLPVTYNETPVSIFGAIYNTLAGTGVTLGPAGNVPNPTGPNYVVQFTYSYTADACGVFDINFNLPPNPPPLSAYFTPTGAQWGSAAMFQPLQLIIGPTNDDCADRATLSGQMVSQPVSLGCATLDGPVTCGAATADVWYNYTTPVPCELDVNVTGGLNVAVYQGVGCTPVGGGTCGPLVDSPTASGTQLLIQVSGAVGGAGTLNIVCAGCSSNADCNDSNPCTTDICNLQTQVCSNTPTTGAPCSDGNGCTLNDTCNAAGACVPGPANTCNDFNPCTVDTCVAPGGACSNEDVDGDPCTGDADCADTGTCTGNGGTTCECQAANNNNPNDSVRLDVNNCDNGGTAITGLCTSNDDECNPPSPDGVYQCSDDDGNRLNGGICVDQCCYQPGSNISVDLELGPMPDGACGGQFFIEYDSCLTLKDKDLDPDGELGWSFVVSNLKGDGTIDLALSLPPGIPCEDATATFLGGTIARLYFTANGECKCGGVDFRPHNPPTKVTGPKGDIDLSELTGTDEIQIQGDPVIACPPNSEDHADCGSIFRTVTYGPVTVSDDCESIDAAITDLCEVEYRKACSTNLDCGRGDICGAFTDCGAGSFCETDPLVDGAGFDCGGFPCTGYCTIDTCQSNFCATPRVPAFDVNEFLDCSDGCQLPPGKITVVCSYTNGCGRTAECNSEHSNSGLNKLVVDLELSPSVVPGDANDPISRCIDFELAECDAAGFPVCHAPYGDGTQFCSPLDQNACGGHPEACFPAAAGNTITISEEVVFGLPSNLAGHGQACLKVPPGNWTCLTATDPKHSLTSTCTVACNENNQLYAEFKGSKAANENCHWLVQGNLDGNPNIDIADYTILAGEYLSNYGTNSTPCKTGPVEGNNFNADMNGDGLVTLADWTFVVFNFFNSSKDPCSVVCDATGASAVTVRRAKPRLSMTRAELEKAGLGEYVDAADVDGDGVVTLEDMSRFLDGESGSEVPQLKDAVERISRQQRERGFSGRERSSR
jgi:hypothetical protein